jgi:hypothetical protein
MTSLETLDLNRDEYHAPWLVEQGDWQGNSIRPTSFSAAVVVRKNYMPQDAGHWLRVAGVASRLRGTRIQEIGKTYEAVVTFNVLRSEIAATELELVDVFGPLVSVLRKGFAWQAEQENKVGAPEVSRALMEEISDREVCVVCVNQIVRMFAYVARHIETGQLSTTSIGVNWQFVERFPAEVLRRFPLHPEDISRFLRELYACVYSVVESGGKVSGDWGSVCIVPNATGALEFRGVEPVE